jgi:glutathione S-transferase
MSLTLYYHPLSSFCWKTLTALYESKTPFTPLLINFGDQDSAQKLFDVWPMGEFPVLQDTQRNQIIPQSSSVIEYLNLHYAGTSRLIPGDPELALETRRWNDFFDTYIQVHMQKIVADVMRPNEKKDPTGVSDARGYITSAYDILESRMKGRTWMVGDTFTMADCSACPALYYGNLVEALGNKYPSVASYLERLKQRPSFARVVEEAQPYFHFFPYKG